MKIILLYTIFLNYVVIFQENINTNLTFADCRKGDSNFLYYVHNFFYRNSETHGVSVHEKLPSIDRKRI